METIHRVPCVCSWVFSLTTSCEGMDANTTGGQPTSFIHTLIWMVPVCTCVNFYTILSPLKGLCLSQHSQDKGDFCHHKLFSSSHIYNSYNTYTNFRGELHVLLCIHEVSGQLLWVGATSAICLTCWAMFCLPCCLFFNSSCPTPFNCCQPLTHSPFIKFCNFQNQWTHTICMFMNLSFSHSEKFPGDSSKLLGIPLIHSFLVLRKVKRHGIDGPHVS